MDSLITFAITALILGFFLLQYWLGKKKRDREAAVAAEKGTLHSSGPQSQHPHIDMTYCIGCASCTMICPEGDVLAMLGGKAVIVNGHKCIGHGLCADACPVGASTMVMASPSVAADNPYLTPEYETSIPNMFIVGELGGLALIKNAVNQGRDCVDTIRNRFADAPKPASGVYEVLVVGSGPAGISAALRATEHQLDYIVLEQEDTIGGTVAKYPKQKLVMTSPVEFPTYGKFKKTELSKENLVAFWEKVMRRADFRGRTGEKVTDIQREPDGTFIVASSKGQYRTRSVVLALGKTGSPRKLGIKGEELPKVMYRLIEADHYVHKRILVVGGGDSAVEAAMGLSKQVGNKVTLSYRKDGFARIKERNAQRIQECMRSGSVRVVFNSMPVEVKGNSALLEVDGALEEIPNDFVWVFAGGEPPTAFLKKIGIRFGLQDVTSDVSNEAKQAKNDREQTQTRRTAPQLDGASLLPEQEVASKPPPKPNEKPGSHRKLGVPGEELLKVAYRLNDAQAYQDKDVLVVGASDLAVRAALSLGYMGRNRVSLAIPSESLVPTELNRQILLKLEEEQSVRVLKKTELVKITREAVVLRMNGDLAELPNDAVFILANDPALPELPNVITQTPGPLAPCPRCSKPVAQESAACPACGAPMSLWNLQHAAARESAPETEYQA